jgi:hypothetical protein
MLLIGLGARAPAPMPFRSLLPMPLVQQALDHLEAPEHQFLRHFHGRVRARGVLLRN